MQRQTIETTYLVTLVEKIKQWHYDRNLIDGANDKDQVCKLIQEVGELSDNVCKGKDVSDDIGDCIVVLINIAERNKLSLTECIQQAYNDIADRKGRMVDGIFVKEADDIEDEDLWELDADSTVTISFDDTITIDLTDVEDEK